jgi:hypothetical protein
MSEEQDKVVVDFQRKETEAGWIRIADSLGAKGTSVWFGWLEWILVLSAFEYLFLKTRSIYVVPILAVSGALLLLHFNALFFRIEFKGVPFFKKFEKSRLFAIVVSGLLAFGFFKLACHLALLIASQNI